MSFLTTPPEINSLRMFSGAGSAPMLEAAAAWDGLASELSSAAESFSSVTSGLVGQAWQGPASVAMVAAATPYAGWLSAAAVSASGAAAQAKAVAGVFESALSATAHPMVVAANRSELVQMVMSNFFGLNAPVIAAVESQYEQMWAADVAAMVGYHGGASAAAAQLTSLPQLLQNLPAQVSSINLGFGNTGNVNLGSGNTGSYNTGSGNTGSLNFGFGNTGGLNFGVGNFGSTNMGFGNGAALTLDAGGGRVSIPSSYNFGNGNLGSYNLGTGNLGSFNLGWGNKGSHNLGFANLGSSNIGFGNDGSGDIGIGLTGDGQIGIGGLNLNGAGWNLGLANSGSFNVGFANTGNHNFGLANTGSHDTGLFNAGSLNTGFLNPGSYDMGMANRVSTARASSTPAARIWVRSTRACTTSVSIMPVTATTGLVTRVPSTWACSTRAS
jgi:PPE-repeat protein